MLQAFDVLPRDAYVHQPNLCADFLFRFLNSLLDGGHRTIDVGHDATGNAHRLASTVAEKFNFSELVLLADETGNFGRANVEADNNFCRGVVRLIVHHG